MSQGQEARPDAWRTRAEIWRMFDDSLAPDDSHAGLLRFIQRRRRWQL